MRSTMKFKTENYRDKNDLPAFRVYSPYNPAFIKSAWECSGKFNKEAKAWEFPASRSSDVAFLLQESYSLSESPIPERISIEITFLENVKEIGANIEIAGYVIVKAGRDMPIANVGWDGEAGSYFDSEYQKDVCFIEDGAEIEINDVDINDFAAFKSDSRVSVRRINN